MIPALYFLAIACAILLVLWLVASLLAWAFDRSNKATESELVAMIEGMQRDIEARYEATRRQSKYYEIGKLHESQKKEKYADKNH